MIMHRGEQTLAIRALKSAAPYIRMYKGKTFVVKAGGGVFGDADATRVLIEQIAILHYFGVRVVMVHGGGPQTTEISEALGNSRAHGRGSARDRPEGHRCGLDGAQRPDQHADPRNVPGSQHRCRRNQWC